MKFSILKLTPFATTNRVREIKDGSTGLVNYVHRGIKSTVSIQYVEPEITMTYLRQSGTGDRYTGLDRFNRIADIPWRKSGSDVEHYQYGFDRAGNRTWRANVVAAAGSHAFDEGYAYDGLYQLNDLRRGLLNISHIIGGTPAWEEQFAYDPTGNWDNYTTKVDGAETLDQDRTHDPANEILTIDGSGTNVSYDGVGNMTRMPFAGWSDHRNLIWDAWNRLVKIMDGDEEVAIYRYDALTRRIEKFCGDGSTWVHRHFYYSDQWQVLEERINNTIIAERQFVWGLRYTDDLVLRDRFDAPASSSSSGSSSSSSSTERLYATHDQWHVTAITDATGAVVERYAYEAFGQTIVLAPSFTVRGGGSSYEWETRFGAYRWEWGSQLYQVRYRYLHSSLGRWLSRDPILEDGGFNIYALVSNCPVNYVDYLGLYEKTWDKQDIVTIKAKNCEIVILDGHGSDKKAHKFEFPEPGKGCGAAGGFIGCYPGQTNSKIPAGNLIPNTSQDMKVRADWYKKMDKERQDVFNGAKEKATDLCKCCENVTITVTDTNKPLGWYNFLSTPPEQDVEWVVDCKTGTVTRTKGRAGYYDFK